MRRKALLWLLTAMACGIGLVGLYSKRSWMTFYGSPGQQGNSFGVFRGNVVAEYTRTLKTPRTQDFAIDIPGFRYHTRTAWAGGVPPTERVYLSVSVWPAFLLLAAYPLLHFLYAPVRVAKLRARNQCHKCCYFLIGNKSGVCPECGEPLAAGIVPRWRRILNAVLCAVVAGWFIDFIMDQILLGPRIAVWLIRAFGDQVGAWMIVSTLRVLPTALICVVVYMLLSQERFPDAE